MAAAPVESVCKTKATSKTGAIEWQIDAWSALPDEHVVDDADDEQVGRTFSETIPVAGDKWSIMVCPGGLSDEDDTEEEAENSKEYVAIYLHYKGESEALRTKQVLDHPRQPAAG